MSVTYVGVLVLLLSSLAKSAGLQISNDALTNFILVGAQLVGALIALWGRYRAGGIKWFGGRKYSR